MGEVGSGVSFGPPGRCVLLSFARRDPPGSEGRSRRRWLSKPLLGGGCERGEELAPSRFLFLGLCSSKGSVGLYSELNFNNAFIHFRGPRPIFLAIV